MVAQESVMRVEPSPKRVRVMLDGRFVADSSNALLVWEKPYYPTYFFPRGDVDEAVRDGEGCYTHQGLDDYVALRWAEFDHWFEEDEEVFVHARDPFKRVDILRSSRHVVVELDGVVLADSTKPTLLFETSLPRRHYLPMTDVRMEFLQPSPTRTQCPYKGEAHYWSIHLGEDVYPDLVWSYASPVRESAPIAGLMCFFDEKLDITVDGVKQTRPSTPFS
jgi:uncharacterized protein (DUF427 family)